MSSATREDVRDTPARAEVLLARTGPLALIGASLVLAVGGLTIATVTSGALAFVVMAVTLVAAAGGRAFEWRRLLPGLLAVVSVTWSNWFLSPDRALEPALVAGLRIAYFVWPSVVAAGFVDASALGDHLGQRLRLPPRPVLAAVAAMQRIDSLGDEWNTIAQARRARGLAPERGMVARAKHVASMTLALLVESLRQAQTLSIAMDARGYSRLANQEHRRTWAEPAPWTGTDTLVVAVAVVLAALPSVFWGTFAG